MPERCGKGRCRRAGPRHEQNAGCVLIEPMNQAGRLVGIKAKRLGQAVHMARLPASTLHRKARRLVQRQDMRITPKHAGADHICVSLRDFGFRLWRRVGLRQGRDAHALAFLHLARRFGAGLINAQVTLAAHLFNHTLAQLRKATFEPAIQTLIPLARRNGEMLNPAHGKSVRPSAVPINTDARQRRTVPTT